jgi:hypothetical protein
VRQAGQRPQVPIAIGIRLAWRSFQAVTSCSASSRICRSVARLGPKMALSPRKGVRGEGGESWSSRQSPDYPGREIRIGPRYYSIIEVCGIVDQFTDRLPERVFLKLRSYVHDYPDDILWADLAADPSYATAARCLRKMIERRTEDRKLREAWRRNLE